MGATFVLVCFALSFWLLFRFYQVVFLVFIAIVMGTVIRPVVTWMQQHRLPRVLGVILVYLLLLALVVGFIFLLFPLIMKQGATIVAAVPGYYQTFREWMVNLPEPMITRLGEFLPAMLPALAPAQQTGQQVIVFAGLVVGYVPSVAKGVFLAMAVLLLAFHWTLDGPRTIQSLVGLVPKSHRENIGQLITAMSSKVGYYVIGQSILCLVIGTMALIAYLLIGLPNALVLAFLAGVMEAVPLVGPLLGAVPAGIIALSIGPVKLVWVIVATVVIQQLENIILVPRVMRRAVGVNPFVSLLSIFAFSSLFGIGGALMAIPIAALLQILLDRFVFHPAAVEPEVPIDRDFAGRLRYEAQDLAQDFGKQARLTQPGSDLKVKQIDQVLDEIEAITTDLDALLAQINQPGAP